MDCPLSDMVIDDGSWNLELFHLWVFEEVINSIVGVLPPHPSSGPENIICNVLQLVPFLNSAYGKLQEATLSLKEPVWLRRGVSNGSACGLHEHGFEEVLHVLRDYPVARDIWNKLIPTGTSRIPPYKNHISGSSPQLSSNWVRLNTNGLVRIEEGFATAEGLARDHNGRWIIGFGRYLGNNRVREPELWGILDGLKLIMIKALKEF
ncbi:hypothetical protein Goklo_028008 [Gossypium klotzschianum]|uniref:RNase H type-1 domain-containing protein n=1 Tax=Gossypium klotzschianum TaxID=34286 RepID=A0A7J8U0E3_9ROSI|nr:hypothetical protein [Gossypium klotzschianum]